MLTKVQKWGNSLAIRIPKSFAQNIHLGKDDNVEVLHYSARLQIRLKDTLLKF